MIFALYKKLVGAMPKSATLNTNAVKTAINLYILGAKTLIMVLASPFLKVSVISLKNREI